ncbi:hypothetical protein [Endozoicomonas euniceicola]|uniref:Uncharacterized protein n=1 Tax=Endozoicomonas euniceicola TaxID=1234143 RepID=A0ABY6GQJ9_9GAMM|nr:hypothetical protein [Endozoicomonas euniceicola]UYM14284.1 hypothetical protein NX720_15405 [Endozoicomonas euniceicola]
MNKKFQGIIEIIEGYGFHSLAVKPEKKGELIGFSVENGICLTMFIDGRFFPEVDYWLPVTGVNNAVAHPEELKDKFAGQALVGFLAGGMETADEKAAKYAYNCADAMLAERKRRKESC